MVAWCRTAPRYRRRCWRVGENSAWRINRSEPSFAQQKAVPPRHRISRKPVRSHDVTAAINRGGSGKVSARDINRHELPAPAQEKAVGALGIVVRSDNLPSRADIKRNGERTAGEIDRGEGRVLPCESTRANRCQREG